jgi:U3 small nucleolar RNA-associated protein 15
MCSFNIDCPVESVVTKDSLVIVAGSKTITVYDLVAGKVLTTMQNVHSKTITCLATYEKFLLSGSLDGHLKIYDNMFKNVTSLKYASAQILNIAVNSKCLVIGANDGLVMVKKFRSNQVVEQPTTSSFSQKKNMRYFTQINESQTNNNNNVDDSDNSGDEVDEDTLLITDKAVKRLRTKFEPHDIQLRGFNHSKGLDMAVKKHAVERPQVVTSFMQELIRRSALRASLAGRSDKQLKPIMDFLYKNIRDPKLSSTLIDVASILTEIYTPHVNRSKKLQSMFSKVSRAVNSEIVVMQHMKMLAGQISMIISHC